jgi:hypothetical protein
VIASSPLVRLRSAGASEATGGGLTRVALCAFAGVFPPVSIARAFPRDTGTRNLSARGSRRAHSSSALPHPAARFAAFAPPHFPMLGLVALASALFLAPALAEARTFPSEVRKLTALKAELESRGLGYLLDTWVGDDPCGPTAGAPDSWGAWHYVACRALPAAEREALLALGENAAARRTPASYFAVTNVHLSDLNVEGELDALDALCAFSHLRELDLDGGRLTGPIPRWLGRCFPELTELDLSHNRLSGAIPRGVWRGLPKLRQVKLEDNRLTGAIPRELAALADLRVLWLDDNDLVGRLPPSFGHPGAFPRIISFNVEDNPRLCGALPPGIEVDWRWHLANQAGQERDWFAFCEKDPCGVFVYGGTGIGTKRACPDDSEKPTSAPSCGKVWDQCGGTVAVERPESPGAYVDAPFDGARCCRRGLRCAFVPANAPCKSGAEGACSFYQCVPERRSTSDGGVLPDAPSSFSSGASSWALPGDRVRTSVPDAIVSEYRAAVGSAEAPCAPPFAQCGGTAAYAGATCCEGAAPCTRQDEFWAFCDAGAACAGAREACGGAMAAANSNTCCRAGLECVVLDESYHECVPKRKIATLFGAEALERDPSGSGKLVRREKKRRAARPRSAAGDCAGDRERCDAGDDGACCAAAPSDADARINDVFSQKSRCVRKTPAFASCESCAGTYGQCGGVDFDGGNCCAEVNDACVRVDEYYSQCRPSESE